MTKYRRRRIERDYAWLMPLVDVGLSVLAFILAYVARYQLQLIRPVGEAFAAPFEPYIPYAIIYVVWLYFTYRGTGLYRLVRGRTWLDEVYTIINGVTNATVVLLAVSFIFQPLVFSRLMMIYVAAITIVLLSAARLVRRIVQARLRSRGIGVQRAVIVGSGDVGRAVLRSMLVRKELGYHVVGVLDDDPDRGNVDLGRVRGLGNLDNMARVLHDEAVDLVVITLPWRYHEKIVSLIQQCQKYRVEVSVVPDLFQLNMRQVMVENVDGIPLLRVNGHVPLKGSNRLLKRALDMALIILFLPLIIPLFALVALAIRLEGDGPIFYKAQRVGENGHLFNMIKFRSMIPNADQMRDELVRSHELDPRHPKIKDDPRITSVGRFIRRTSIDELPNLF
ncbi:hypothetical protein FBR02_03900, partial [Anaerolineae bacterium CFX9]|nr:hypothetical protein [Anaerolineae bacterium CFX9]